MRPNRTVWWVACLFGNVGLMLTIVADYLFHASRWQAPLLWTYLAFMVALWVGVVPWQRGRQVVRSLMSGRRDRGAMVRVEGHPED